MGEVEIGPESRPPWEYSRGWARENLLLYKDIIPGGIGGLKIPLLPGQARTERVRMSQEEIAHQQRRSQRAENNLKFVIPRMKSQEPQKNTVHDWIISILNNEKQKYKQEEESGNMNESCNNTKAETDFKIKIYNKFLLSEQNKLKQKLITEVSNRDLEQLQVLSRDNASDPNNTEVYVINDPSRGYVKNVGGYDISTELSPVSMLGMIALGGLAGGAKGVIQGSLRKRAAVAKLARLNQKNRAAANMIQSQIDSRVNTILNPSGPWRWANNPTRQQEIANVKLQLGNELQAKFAKNARTVARGNDIHYLRGFNNLAYRAAEVLPTGTALAAGAWGAANSVKKEYDMRKAGLSNNTDADMFINAATQFVSPYIGGRIGNVVGGAVNRKLYRNYIRNQQRIANTAANAPGATRVYVPGSLSLLNPQFVSTSANKSLFGSRTSPTPGRGGFKGYRVNNADIYNLNPEVGINAYNNVQSNRQRIRYNRIMPAVGGNIMRQWHIITDPILPSGRGDWKKVAKSTLAAYLFPSVLSAASDLGGNIGLLPPNFQSSGAPNEWNRFRGDNITKQAEIPGRKQATADVDGAPSYQTGYRVAAGGWRASETEAERRHAAKAMASDRGRKQEYDADRIYIVKKTKTGLDFISGRPDPIDVIYAKKQTPRHRRIVNAPLDPMGRLVTLPTDPDLLNASDALIDERR